MKSWIKKYTLLLIFVLLLMLSVGCGNQASSVKITIAYNGNIYETPLFAAYEKGFFKKEGVQVSLVKVGLDEINKSVSSGKASGATFDYRVFDAQDREDDIKLVAGLHSSCTRIIADSSSTIKTISDLKDKKIGITALGNSSMVVTSDLLKENGIDPVKSINWVLDSEENLLNKLKNKEVDAVCTLEYLDKSKNILNNNQRLIYSSSDEKDKGKSYKHFYESFIGYNSRFLKNNRKEAFAASIAWLKAAQWVSGNQKEALDIAVSKGYVDNGHDLDKIVSKYMWMPGVKYARDNVGIYVKWQRENKILSKDLTEGEFMKKIYDPLIPELNGR